MKLLGGIPIRIKMGEILSNLQNHMLGDPNVMPCTMRCVHGSNNEILSEWNPGPTYVV